jgi:hypothetical protein
LSFAFVDLHLFLPRDERRRPVEQIETGIQRKSRAAQAAVAFRLHLHLQAALDADFALGIGQQFGRSLRVQRTRLPDFVRLKIQIAGCVSFVETNLPQFHLFDAKEHRNTRERGGVKCHYSADLRAEFTAGLSGLRAEFTAGLDGLRAEFTAGLDGLRAEFTAGLDGLRTEFQDRLTAAVVAIRQDFAERMGAAAVAFGTDFSELRKELGVRIDTLGRRMVALEHRMDRLTETTSAIATELAALTRWASRLDRENLETLNTQAAQQLAIDDLAKRLRPPNQPPS